MRTTQKELTALLDRMRSVSGLNLHLGGAYGGTKVYEELPTGGARSMSGYLPAGQLAAWMRAWLDGHAASEKRHKQGKVNEYSLTEINSKELKSR